MKKIILKNEEMFPEVSKMLEDGFSVTIPVKGFSMLPTIVAERDLVVLEAAPSYRKDDIVLFCLAGRWILHRVIRVDGEAFTIRGDGILRNVEKCFRGDIRGRAVTILRKGTKPVNPYSRRQILRLRLWNLLRPFRRYLLYLYRHLPWISKYLAII